MDPPGRNPNALPQRLPYRVDGDHLGDTGGGDRYSGGGDHRATDAENDHICLQPLGCLRFCLFDRTPGLHEHKTIITS